MEASRLKEASSKEQSEVFVFSFQGISKNLNKIATQRSGWDFERKNYGVSELWTLGRSEGYEVSSDAVGVDWGVGPPVPIPNTEVKHTFADNTCWVTGREDR